MLDFKILVFFYLLVLLMAEASMEVVHDFEFTKDILLYLQLDTTLLSTLHIRDKIKLCLLSCKNFKIDNTIIAYTIVKVNEELKEILKRLYTIIISIKKLIKTFKPILDKIFVSKDTLVSDVMLTSFNILVSGDISNNNRKKKMLNTVKKAFEGPFRNIINQIFNYKKGDDINKEILTQIFKLENKIFIDKWLKQIDKSLTINREKKFDLDSVTNMYSCFKYFYNKNTFDEINKNIGLPYKEINEEQICSEFKDITIGVAKEGENKKRKHETEDTEKEKESTLSSEHDKEYTEDTFSLAKTELNLLLLDIDKIIFKHIGSDVDSIVKYDIYLKSYTADIFRSCKFYNLILKSEILTVNEITINEYKFNNFKNLYNFNIICYGKSLFYLLKYIYFIIIKGTKNEDKYNFILYCDINSYKKYQENLVVINKKLKERNDIVSYEFDKLLTFSHILNSKYTQEKFSNCNFEIKELKKLKVNIYFLVSEHYLVRGIGAKRGLANCMNFYISMKTNMKENYLSMHLDDNNTTIVDRRKVCDYDASKKKHCLIPACINSDVNCNANETCELCKCDSILDSDSVNKVINPETNRLIELKSLCNNYLKKNQIFCNLKGGNDKTNCETPAPIDCPVISILELYELFIKDKDNFKDTYIIGIKRDHMNVQIANNNYYKTSSIYKLSLQKSFELYTKGYQYNPFFTRFFEDMPFNLVNSGLINNAYYLRFAHLPLCSEKIYENYEDYFKSFIIKTDAKIPDAVPLFIMYLHYLFKLKLVLNLEKTEKPSFKLTYQMNNTSIQPFAQSRYNQFNYILYKLLLAQNEEDKKNEGNYITDIVEICKKEVIYIKNNFVGLDSSKHNDLIKKFNEKIKQRKSDEKDKKSDKKDKKSDEKYEESDKKAKKEKKQ